MRGFTLIELSLVIVFILIILGLSAPALKNALSDITIKDAAYNLAKLAAYAQEHAVLSGQDHKIIFDYQKGTYRLFAFGQAGTEGAYTRVKDRFGRLIKAPAGIVISGSAPEIFFHPDGSCSGAEIILKNASGAGYTVTLKAFGALPEITEIKSEK